MATSPKGGDLGRRTPLSRARADRGSGRRVRPAARSDARVARCELRRRRVLITPAGRRGVVNDAVAILLPCYAALAAAFVSRWCRQRLPEVCEGAFVMRGRRAGAAAPRAAA